jgi:hypothetical protein
VGVFLCLLSRRSQSAARNRSPPGVLPKKAFASDGGSLYPAKRDQVGADCAGRWAPVSPARTQTGRGTGRRTRRR